ncbi:Pre-mRNA-splicing factor Isy1 like protein [Aduncisulcus paluster]|uniref:Pre-mRNA-splicing factor Isy1 like protein n=1 Tax=Aduncisulcus paluster TaxID=2918883 RepID=A0ABQ5KMH7_9EUKA|nr:Pre-mRNA-splicing factor Isy1 like protein [Aduncisulcus paluster]
MDIYIAEDIRRTIIYETKTALMHIQGDDLAETRIRELNSRISQLIWQRRKWEERIIELGGNDYRRYPSVSLEKSYCKGPDGKKYWGAAKELPEVREFILKHKLFLETKKAGESVMQSLKLADFGFALKYHSRIGDILP